jgi:hypothetical protein|uniref:glucoamylase family protein n=1 Tax=Algoriphagus sp. TaxID=1872435 RepID=UPI0040479F9A
MRTFLLFLSIFSTACVSAEKNSSDIKIQLSDEQLLDTVQYYTFQYFWKGAEPNSGMAPERIHWDGNYPAQDAHIVTTGGTGMGLIGILGAIERGWISQAQAIERFQKILNFLEKADRWQGIWPHWLDGKTGKVKPFSQKDDGADLVESAFLMQGLLAVREYYKNGSAEERSIASRIHQLWVEMEWDFHSRGENVLYWHWSPNFSWDMNFALEGYNEALIAYILAASSPTYSIDAPTYHQGWGRSGRIRAENAGAYGFSLQLRHQGAEKYGGPLFWAHYSFLGLNPKGLKDQYADYWTENRNQTLINRAWCIANPGRFQGYGEKLWGLTASYSTSGYHAHRPDDDKGVISPTAAISSIVYTPKESMAVIRNLYETYGKKVFGPYGFYDALSPEYDYFPQQYLAIDQGPAVSMLENYRTGLGWKLFMQAPEVQEGLKKLGFTYQSKN